jgi:flagellar protein FliS
MYLNNAYNAYIQYNVDVESPYKLVEMMYEGILRFTTQAKKSIRNNDVEKKIFWLNKASAIFIELIDILDLKSGDDIGSYLNGLYTYQIQVLGQANVQNDIEKIDSVILVVKGLLEAWRESTKV